MSMFDYACSECKFCTFHCKCDETGEWIKYPDEEPCPDCDDEAEKHLH